MSYLLFCHNKGLPYLTDYIFFRVITLLFRPNKGLPNHA